jgi:RsiW-degrading membrane proteinase PrsW (M82 family)
MPAQPLAILIPAAVSIGVPVAFLWGVRRLDLYGAGGFQPVVVCCVAGILAFPLAFALNRAGLNTMVDGGMAAASALLLVRTLVAPVVEEVCKSLSLVYYARRTEFTYFVDGAIYGFAAGTGFAIIENLFYLSGSSAPLALSVNRAFSTSLMHGSACALVGVAIGRFRFGHGGNRLAALLLGWAAAMAVHMAFNRVVSGPLSPAILTQAVLIGFGGLALTAGFIYWGLRAERAWLREKLNLDVGVSAGEAAVVQQMADLNTLLKPVEEDFGPEKRRQVEAFLRLQAQLGLKLKAAELTGDPQLRAALEAQCATLRAEVDVLRRAVGVYCMAYVRSILPDETEPIWDRIDLALSQAPEPTIDMWQILAARTEDPAAGTQP